MHKKTKITEKKMVQFPCACAIGDLSEFAPVILDKKAKKKIEKKTFTKDELKKEKLNPKQ
jgi:hypothetical protein